MEIPNKRPFRKGLSVLLSIIMVMGCISAAFTVPSFATLGTDVMMGHANYFSVFLPILTELGDAIDTAVSEGAMDTAEFSGFTNPNNGSGTVALAGVITDKSPEGYILEAAMAFQKILGTNTGPGFIVGGTGAISANPENSFSFTWWTNLYSGLRDYYGYGAAGKEKELNLLAALAGMKANNGNGADLVLKSNGQFIADWVTHPNRTNSSAVFNVSLTVGRSELVALQGATSYQDVLDLKDAGPTQQSYRYGVNGASIGSGSNRYRRFTTLNASNPIAPTQPTAATNAEADKLIAFHDYFFGGVTETDPLVETDPFNDYSLSEITDVVSANGTAWAAWQAVGLTEADIDRIFGTDYMSAQDVQDFMADCSEAMELLTARPDIAYFMDEMGSASVGGTLFGANEGFVAMVAAKDYEDLTKTQLDALWSEQDAHFAVIDALSPAMKALAATRFGLDLTAINDAQEALHGDIDLTGLRELKAEIDAAYAPYQAHKDSYTGEIPDSVPTDGADPMYDAYIAYETYIESFFADRNGEYEYIEESGYTDGEISYYDASMAACVALLEFYLASPYSGPAAVDMVFTEGTAYAYEIRARFGYEAMRRDMEGDLGTSNSLRNHYVYFNRIRVNDMGEKSTQDLLDMINEAAAKQTDFIAKMLAAEATIGMPGSGSLTGNSWKLMYEDFLPKIDEVVGNKDKGITGKLNATLIGRLTGWVDNALQALGSDAPDEVTYENVVQLRRVFENLLADGMKIYDYLIAAELLNDPIAAKLAAGMLVLYGDGVTDGILKKYLDFVGTEYATDKHSQKTPDYPNREGMDPIVPYEDLARILGEDYTLTGGKMDDVVAKLDALLTSPIFGDVACDISGLISGLPDSIYSDCTVNALLNALYPAIADGLEEQLLILPQSAPGGVSGFDADCTSSGIKMLGGALCPGCGELDLSQLILGQASQLDQAIVDVPRYNVKSLHEILDSEGLTDSGASVAQNSSIYRLRLYPDLLYKMLDGSANPAYNEYASLNPGMQLAEPTNDSGLWNDYGSYDYSSCKAAPYVSTGAWKHPAILEQKTNGSGDLLYSGQKKNADGDDLWLIQETNAKGKPLYWAEYIDKAWVPSGTDAKTTKNTSKPVMLETTENTGVPAIGEVTESAGNQPVYGGLNFKWGIDDPSGVLAGMDKKTRFYSAMAAVLDGVWPLLEALFCGKDIRLDHPYIANATVRIKVHVSVPKADYRDEIVAAATVIAYTLLPNMITGNVTANITLDKAELGLNVEEGNPGYAWVLTSFFESVLGITPDHPLHALIPSLAELEAYTEGMEMVGAIFEPLLGYIDSLAQAPVGSLLELLPNLAYAMMFDRINYALNKLEVNLAIVPNGIIDIPQSQISADSFSGTLAFFTSVLPGCVNTCVNNCVRPMFYEFSIRGISHGCLGCVKDQPIPDPPPDPSLPGNEWKEASIDNVMNVPDLVGADCFTCLSYPDTTCQCLLNPDGCLGGLLGGILPAGMPCLKIGELVQYGEMEQFDSKRPPNELVTYTAEWGNMSVPDGTYYDALVVGTEYDDPTDGWVNILRDPANRVDRIDGVTVQKKDGDGNPLFLATVQKEDGDGNPLFLVDDGYGNMIETTDDDFGANPPVMITVETTDDDGGANPPAMITVETTDDDFGANPPVMITATAGVPVVLDGASLGVDPQTGLPFYAFVTESKPNLVSQRMLKGYSKSPPVIVTPAQGYHIDAAEGDVLLFLLRYLFQPGTIGLLGGLLDGLLDDPKLQPIIQPILDSVFANAASHPDDAIAAIVELIFPQLYGAPPVAYGDPAFAAKKYPVWWATDPVGGTAGGAAKAEEDANYVIENADAIADFVWKTVMNQDDPNVPQTFGAEVDKLLRGAFANKKTLTDLQGTLSGILPDDLDDMVKTLLEGIIIDGNLIDLVGMFDDVANVSLPAGPITPATIGGFMNGLAKILAPLGPILDFLLAGDGMKLELLNVGDVGSEEGLISLLGYNGYEKAVIPILKAFTDPFGLSGLIMDGTTWNGLGIDYEGKLNAILDPLAAVIEKILEAPVVNLLELLPNLVYFVSNDKDGGPSPLQQSLDLLLKPLYVLVDTLRPLVGDLFGMIMNLAGSSLNLPAGIGIGEKGIIVDANALLGGLLGGDLLGDLDLGLDINFDLGSFLVGTFMDGTWVKADKAALLFALLDTVGVLDLISANGMEALTYLIQYEKLPGIGKIDYGQAPDPTAVEIPDFIKGPQIQFLVDNADAVIEYAWENLIYGNDALMAVLEDLLGGPFPIAETLEKTVAGIWGTDFFIKDNLTMLVDMILDLRVTLDEMTFDLGYGRVLSLATVLKQVLSVGDVPVSLDAIFKPFADYKNTVDSLEIKNADDFKETLTKLLKPALPLLQLFLAGKDLKVIYDSTVNGGEGFLKIYGYDGYASGLLPVLAALGADIPGYMATLTSPVAFEGATEDDQIAAIIDPILFLLNAIAENPVQTLLRMLPNLAYFIGNVYDKDGEQVGQPLLQQAIDRILMPLTVLLPYLQSVLNLLPEDVASIVDTITNLNASGLINDLLEDNLPGIGLKAFKLEDLVVGDITLFKNPFIQMGVNGEEDNKASYIQVDIGKLLVQLLNIAGVFDLLQNDDMNLIGLLDLLNYEGRDRDVIKPIEYPELSVDFGNVDLFDGTWTWFNRDAQAMLDKLPGVIDELMTMLLGSTLDVYLQGLLGDTLFNESNFNGIVKGLQDMLAGLDLSAELIPGKSLKDLLAIPGLITIGGKALDILDVLDKLQNFAPDPAVNVNTQAGFVKELIRFLSPAAPLLDFLLFGQDIKVIDIAVINEGDGTGTSILLIHGQEGYKYGLIPLYEALLVPLGLQGLIKEAGALKDLAPDKKLEAILMPLLTAVDTVLESPLENLLKLLPSIAYFTTVVEPGKGKTPLEQSLDNVVFAVTSVLGVVTGEPATLASLLKLLGVDFALDVPTLLDGLIEDYIGIPGLGTALLKNLLVGTPTTYTSLSGKKSIILMAETKEDQAKVLMALLLTIIELVQGNPDTRELIVTMLGNMIIPEGSFGNKALHWGIHFILWIGRLIGMELSLESIQRLVNFLSWFLPIINWVMKLFG